MPEPKRGRTKTFLRQLPLQLYRLAVLVLIVVMIRELHVRQRIDGDRPIQRNEVREFFPDAAELEADHSERQGLHVLDAEGNRLGYVLRTSPISNDIIGYSGPTDTMIALNQAGKVKGIKIRHSADTHEHVADVKRDDYFLGRWDGKTWDEVAYMDLEAEYVEGTSGATLTSMCIAESIVHRFRQSTVAKNTGRGVRVAGRDIGMAAVIAAALLVGFTRLRGKPWIRYTLQATVVGYVGFINGDLIAQSLLSGWAKSGVPWRLAPGLALLVAAALAVPWATRRPIYCSQLCPHGVAQQWAGRLSPWRVKLPTPVARGLRWLPPGLIGLVIIITMLDPPFELAGIEPFDAYLLGTAGWATIGVAVVGLVASLFVPMAYCKYGCPTGALLEFVRSHGKADHFSRRDLVAGLLLGLTALLYWQHDLFHAWMVGPAAAGS